MALYSALFGPKDEPDIYYDKLVRDYLKFITVSEYDREETPTVYGDIHKITFNRSGLGLDFTPLTVLSNYSFNSRKGKISDFIIGCKVVFFFRVVESSKVNKGVCVLANLRCSSGFDLWISFIPSENE